MNFAFYGQAITTDRPAARSIHVRQLADATARIHRRGGLVVADYFDIYRDRFTALRHRHQARRLLLAIKDRRRGFAAVVIGDTQTALTAMQYQDLLWTCAEHRVQLWVPESDGPVDPDDDAHEEIMKNLFWGTSPLHGNDFP